MKPYELLVSQLRKYQRSLLVEARMQHEAGEYARVETLERVVEELSAILTRGGVTPKEPLSDLIDRISDEADDYVHDDGNP